MEEYFEYLDKVKPKKFLREWKKKELWIRRSEETYPVFDYKIDNDKLYLVLNPESGFSGEIVTWGELLDYVSREGNPRLVPYYFVDETTGKNLWIKDEFDTKTVFEICN